MSSAERGAATRRENDLLGERDVPRDAYWGIHTARALDNFPLSGRRAHAPRSLLK